ncbi:MAG: hypothetical protein K2X61_03800 [Caulobacteraceae bacterium]|nr:hypothetical protein [Caulobacteraceae bacterium]
MSEASRKNIGHAGLRLAAIVAIGGAALLMGDPAWAFSDASTTIVAKTKEATAVAQKILITAAVLALLIGLAPMLWGQVKVKWIVSSLVMCIVVGLVPLVVQAFSS